MLKEPLALPMRQHVARSRSAVVPKGPCMGMRATMNVEAQRVQRHNQLHIIGVRCRDMCYCAGLKVVWHCYRLKRMRQYNWL